jgi:hypothetical protein
MKASHWYTLFLYIGKLGMVVCAWQYNIWIGLAALCHAMTTTLMVLAINATKKEMEEPHDQRTNR